LLQFKKEVSSVLEVSGFVKSNKKRLTLDPNVGIIPYVVRPKRAFGPQSDKAFRPAVTCGRFTVICAGFFVLRRLGRVFCLAENAHFCGL
jgi:hypothetical protein